MHRGNIYWTWILPILLIILILFSIYKIVKNNKENNQRPQAPRNGNQIKSTKALEILNERYAKGEIDDEEYQQIKKNLNE